jgi:predicted RNase H-like nuclease
MFDATDYEAACAARQAVDGRRCSRQLFAIVPKIREVDATMSPPLQERAREGHPEVSFTKMNGRTPMSYQKAKREGAEERIRLLRPHFPDIDYRLSALPRSSLRIDAVDAYALLWSALRTLSEISVSIPYLPQYDARDLRAEIVA